MRSDKEKYIIQLMQSWWKTKQEIALFVYGSSDMDYLLK